MNEERHGTGPHRSTVHDRHHAARSRTPDHAAGRDPVSAAPMLTTVLAGPAMLLMIGATRLLASRTAVADQPAAREEAPEIETERNGTGGALAPPSPPAVAETTSIGGPDDGPDGEDAIAFERVVGEEAGGLAADTVPGADGRDRSERRKRRQRGADEEGEDGDSFAGLGPMVRHLAAMTKELSEAQRTVGRLTAERDLLRQQLGDDLAVPLLTSSAPDAAAARPNKEARIAAKQSARGGLNGTPEIDPEILTRAAQVGRRRRMIALGVLGVLVATMVTWRLMGWPSPIEDVSKQGLTGIAYIGPFMNILLGGFLIYRLMKVGGKAGSWLFPSAEEPKRRRR